MNDEEIIDCARNGVFDGDDLEINDGAAIDRVREGDENSAECGAWVSARVWVSLT